MTDHTNHTVAWVFDGERSLYELRCLDCGQTTPYTTEAPNTLDPQPFERAIEKPEAVTVALDVQSLRHKTKTDWR
jgi:hypothetical protein